MLALRDGNQMGTMVDVSGAMIAIMGGIFLVVVMIVLWNMGLMNGLRRYGEVGLRDWLWVNPRGRCTAL